MAPPESVGFIGKLHMLESPVGVSVDGDGLQTLIGLHESHGQQFRRG